VRIATKLKYPVFVIKAKKVKVYKENNKVYIETPFEKYLLDDRSLEGSFGNRRIQMLSVLKERKSKGYEYLRLYPLKAVIYTEEQLIANLIKYRHIVDSDGKYFNHAPTTFYKVKYKKVLRVILKDDGSCMLMVEGINTPFLLKKHLPSNVGVIYAGIIDIPGRPILLEIVDAKKKTTRRKL
jgi:hypothetical protein